MARSHDQGGPNPPESFQPSEPLKLDSLQRDVLSPQIEAFLDAVRDPEGQAVYRALKAAVDQGDVPPEMAERLGAIVEIALSSGRIRRLFGPGAQLSLNSLYKKTPQGLHLISSIDSLNRALGELKGGRVESVVAALRSPGAYALTIKTDCAQLTLRFEKEGVLVETVEVGSD
ncbi:MAG TPA: hypothetical protein VGI47_08195 [Candidatus Binataceae bacterium]|jgi:hypothetical protein